VCSEGEIKKMPRSRQRACLQDGSKLDINRFARQGFIRRAAVTRPIGIQWTNSYTDELIARGAITADMSGRWDGWFRIKIGDLDQRIILAAYPRRFGGVQWYFVCPYTNRKASVVWLPPGARSFASRHKWGRRGVAYRSQLSTRTDRAHQGQARINSRLCSIGGFNPGQWSFPPKPNGCAGAPIIEPKSSAATALPASPENDEPFGLVSSWHLMARQRPSGESLWLMLKRPSASLKDVARNLIDAMPGTAI
jgi:hypothetical protein